MVGLSDSNHSIQNSAVTSNGQGNSNFEVKRLSVSPGLETKVHLKLTLLQTTLTWASLKTQDPTWLLEVEQSLASLALQARHTRTTFSGQQWKPNGKI